MVEGRFAAGVTLAGGRYRIARMLGRGGMGEVYLADDLVLGQPVALKFLPVELERDTERLARLLDEVALARQVSHPNVCRIYDIGEANQCHFLSMAYIAGEDLSTLLRRIGRLPGEKALDLAVQICRGLEAIHQQGILHRDLKPANLLIDDKGRAVIVDFGLAVVAADITAQEVMHGTPAYMAPEQLAGQGVSIQSDLYALGLVLYKLFTGKPAFETATPPALQPAREQSLPPPPSSVVGDIAPEIEQVILRCLAPEPRHRPASAADVATALAGRMRQAEGGVLQTLVVCAAPGQDALIDALGEDTAAGVVDAHARMVRDLSKQHQGRMTGGTSAGEDEVQVLFPRPIDGVRYALAYHQAFAALLPSAHEAREAGRKPEVALRARAAVHLAEVLPLQDAPAAGDSGPRVSAVTAHARDMATRLVALAGPGQTLLTRGAFDLARQGAIKDHAPVCWLAHGSYELAGLPEPLEIFEVGIDGAAPLCPPPDSESARRRMQQDILPGWRPAPGLPLPERAHWIIERKLSEGGFGEVWLAAHAKTRERHVFKFCYDESRLRALKREITLFRLLKDALGERRDIARLVDWRFDQAPFYIEAAYTDGGNLAEWVEQQGGLGRVPFATRLDMVAQVGTALAAAHSVGILHKDVKPANVLVAMDTDGQVRLQLADFGIGAITERQRLADAGITALGLTEVTGATSAATLAGTRMYMAPELLEGKPATIQGDIYALGVMLYQLVVGDFHRALAPGWERDVEDELLREDIAAAVDGSPGRRIGNAADLAGRVRDLEQRRQERDARRAAYEEARRAKEALVRVRRRRKLTMIALAVVTAFVGVMVIQSRRVAREAERARQESAVSRQVLDFLLDLFEASDPYQTPGEPMTARDLLERGSARIKEELKDQPEIQARLMHTMGVAFGNLGRYGDAQPLLEEALATRRTLHPGSHPEIAESLHALAEVLLRQKQNYERAESLVREALALRRSRLGPEHLAVADSLVLLGEILFYDERWQEAEVSYQEALHIRRRLLGGEHIDIASCLIGLGTVLLAQADYDGAESRYREALNIYQQLLGEESRETAEAVHNLAFTFANRGRYEEAETLFARAVAINRRVIGDEHPYVASGLRYIGWMRVAMGDYEKADAQYQKALAIYRVSAGAEHPDVAAVLKSLGRMEYLRGNYGAATSRYQEASTIYRRLFGEQSTEVAMIDVDMAELAAARGDLNVATSTIEHALEMLRGEHSASTWRIRHAEGVRGWLLGRAGQYEEGERLLRESYEYLKVHHGKETPYTQRARGLLVELYRSWNEPEKTGFFDLHPEPNSKPPQADQ